jgi:hypothetical protein
MKICILRSVNNGRMLPAVGASANPPSLMKQGPLLSFCLSKIIGVGFKRE